MCVRVCERDVRKRERESESVRVCAHAHARVRSSDRASERGGERVRDVAVACSSSR